ncbi:hypothetical protein [Candidatus Avelusimicrobium facis]|uniref:hypothetical protein n=1 Tax=Candidatus Avelusimicrobium facis TaxID=3416203 RepID=UPI0015B59459|nr:MAG TPA: hypothetical protein [Caudoviricetes sp.]
MNKDPLSSFDCLPDWLETPKDTLSPLQRIIRQRARAKRKRMREEWKAQQTHKRLQERYPHLWQK